MINWDKIRIKKATTAPLQATYEVIDLTLKQEIIKEQHPDVFKFKAISVGDHLGQAFFVPMDESSIKTAEYIIRAIKAYEGT